MNLNLMIKNDETNAAEKPLNCPRKSDQMGRRLLRPRWEKR